MKYAFVTLALVAAAQAQTRSDIPECAIPCLDKAIESETSCNVRDYVCVCENFSKVRSIATSCVIEECGADVAVNEVLPATEALCENPTDESGEGEDSTSAAAVTSPSATVTAGTTTVAAETETADETTTVVADTTTVAADTTTVVTSATEVSTTVVVNPPITPNATATGAATSTEASSTETSAVVVDNGAAALTGLGGLAMFALAALAL